MAENKAEYYVAGYRFGTLEDAKQAQLEEKQAAYFESRLSGRSEQNMLAVYDKILDERIFVTPVGWDYLKKMQEELRLLGVEEERIRPIPMYVTFFRGEEDEAKTSARDRIKPAKKRNAGKDKLRLSVMINGLLLVLVLAMFYITLNGSNPNILNYKKAILNEYASWEQELTERENAVRAQEKELGIE